MSYAMRRSIVKFSCVYSKSPFSTMYLFFFLFYVVALLFSGKSYCHKPELISYNLVGRSAEGYTLLLRCTVMRDRQLMTRENMNPLQNESALTSLTEVSCNQGRDVPARTGYHTRGEHIFSIKDGLFKRQMGPIFLLFFLFFRLIQIVSQCD